MLTLLIGEVEVWVDGERAISVDGLTLRDSGKSIIKGMHFETFFGGMYVRLYNGNVGFNAIFWMKDILLNGLLLKTKELGSRT